jgi:hypothetical protein
MSIVRGVKGEALQKKPPDTANVQAGVARRPSVDGAH